MAHDSPGEGLIERAGARASRIAERVFPDPFVFAIALTFLTAALALALTDSTFLPREGPDGRPLPSVIGAWMGSKGFFSDWILIFAFQMCLILVTGHALASSPPVARAIAALARRPSSAGGAAALVAAVAVAASLVNWGLGLIVGALLAREVGASARARGVKIHYPLVVAAGYAGLMTWHGGLSGSAPLKVTNIADIAGLIGAADAQRVGAIPLDRTVGSALNLAVTGGLLVVVPILFYLLAPRRAEAMREAPDYILESRAAMRPPEPPATLGQRLDRSYALGLLTAALGFVWLFFFYRGGGARRLDLNAVNATFLFLGLALHGTPVRYVRAVDEAIRGCGGIILQYPFYAGIMGLLQATGLADILASLANDVSTARTLPLFTFVTACIVNIFVPSGGGQWAVQGPIVMKAALALGVAPEKVVMALAYGDQITNMLQPFWALPLLGLTRLRAGDIMGYSAVVMFLSLPVFVVPLLLF